MNGARGYMRLATGLLAGLLCAELMTSVASAVEMPESITLSPTSKHYRLRAGETTQDQLTIVNDGKTDYTFRVYADPYSVRDESYEPDFSSMRSNTDIASWLSFEKKSYFLKAGETITVKYTMAAPGNAAPGGHYGVIFAETQPTETPSGNSVVRKKRVGAIVYATVDGQFQVGGQVAGLTTPVLQFVPPLRSTAVITNSGNADFATTAEMLVTDVLGNKKYESSKVYQILPGTSRKIAMEWAQSPQFGLFKVTTNLTFLDQQETRNTYVFMAPIWAYLVAVLVGLIGVIYLVQSRRT